jgi:hypothetical protein
MRLKVEIHGEDASCRLEERISEKMSGLGRAP